MDQRIQYRIAKKKFRQRASQLSKLDSAAEQSREIGLLAYGLEEAANQKQWLLAERLTTTLIKLRESQQRAKKENGQLVELAEFRHAILGPLLDAISARLQAALPNDFEAVIDLIESDVRAVHPCLLLEDKR